MVQQSESTFRTRDGTSLYTKTWTPDSPSGIHLVFVHGFSDHVNAYYDLFPTLASPPYNVTVHGFDQRGWGRSTASKSDRGRTGDTHQVLSDIHDFISHVTSSIKDPKAKLFLMGHSMGGAESLMYLLTEPSRLSSSSSSSSSSVPPVEMPVSGLLLEAPHIGFPPQAQPNSLVVFSGRMASKIFPNMQMVQKLDSSAMSRNPQVCKDWENDELCHDTGTLRGLAGLLDRASYLNGFGDKAQQPQLGMTGKLPCPVWWAHGSGDQVCSFPASKRLYEKLVSAGQGSMQAEQSKFVSYEGGYHKLHGEPDGMAEQFARDAGNWILHVADIPQATAGTRSKPDDESQDVKSRL